MFKNKIQTEPIPERVFALYKVMKVQKNIEKNKLQEMLTPSFLNSSDYFSRTLQVAQELELVIINGDYVILNNQVETLNTIENLRKYVNSLWGSQFSEGPFSKVTKCIFDAGRDCLKYNNVSSMTDIVPFVTDNREMLGWRFWASFLGLGVLTMPDKIDRAPQPDNTKFLPNASNYLLDIIVQLNFEKDKKYNFDEFVDSLNTVAKPLVSKSITTKQINFGLSNALRTLHDQKFIQLEFINDQKSVWMLDKLEFHPIVDRVTHVTILK